MTEKRKPGRPNTHLSESPIAVRMPTSMAAQVKAAAAREAIAISAWLRRAIQRALDMPVSK